MKSDAYSLSTVAASDRLFVKHRTEFQIERISLKEITQLLVVVRDLVNTLKATPYSRSGIKTLSEGNELLDFTLDETNTANLEHLLLCLKDQLLRLLVAKLIELVHKHVVKCQRDQNKHVDEWFFTYPDARHPLSTTWPWSIRPSLAVLWGVCWMFYDFHRFLDNEGNMLDEQGRMIATRQQVETFLLHRRQQEGIYPGKNQESNSKARKSESASNFLQQIILAKYLVHKARTELELIRDCHGRFRNLIRPTRKTS